MILDLKCLRYDSVERCHVNLHRSPSSWCKNFCVCMGWDMERANSAPSFCILNSGCILKLGVALISMYFKLQSKRQMYNSQTVFLALDLVRKLFTFHVFIYGKPQNL